MELCSNGHPEICYTDRSCPLCVLQDRATMEEESAKDKILDLENKIEELENQIENLTRI